MKPLNKTILSLSLAALALPAFAEPNIHFFGGKLRTGNGIPLQQVMQEIANNKESLYEKVDTLKYPLESQVVQNNLQDPKEIKEFFKEGLLGAQHKAEMDKKHLVVEVSADSKHFHHFHEAVLELGDRLDPKKISVGVEVPGSQHVKNRSTGELKVEIAKFAMGQNGDYYAVIDKQSKRALVGDIGHYIGEIQASKLGQTPQEKLTITETSGRRGLATALMAFAQGHAYAHARYSLDLRVDKLVVPDGRLNAPKVIAETLRIAPWIAPKNLDIRVLVYGTNATLTEMSLADYLARAPKAKAGSTRAAAAQSMIRAYKDVVKKVQSQINKIAKATGNATQAEAINSHAEVVNEKSAEAETKSTAKTEVKSNKAKGAIVGAAMAGAAAIEGVTHAKEKVTFRLNRINERFKSAVPQAQEALQKQSRVKRKVKAGKQNTAKIKKTGKAAVEATVKKNGRK